MHFGALKHAADRVFHDVFEDFSVETRRKSHVLQGFEPETFLKSHFDQPSENGSWLIQLLYEQDHSLAQLGGAPQEAPREGK